MIHNRPKQKKGINSLSFPFEDDDIMTNVSNSKDESHDNHEHDIEIEYQEDPNPNAATIPNQRRKWAQKLIEAVGNIVGDPDDRRRTRSQYKKEHVVLSHSVSLSSVR